MRQPFINDGERHTHVDEGQTWIEAVQAYESRGGYVSSKGLA